MAMASDSSASFLEGKAAVNPWFIAIAVMLATFMEVLDTSIANVALNHIAGNLSASTDEATWVLTSYLVPNAVVLPATGWLGPFFGRKRFLIVCIGIFTIASALCGLASSLGLLILAGAGAERRADPSTSGIAEGSLVTRQLFCSENSSAGG
jgi:MFS transporter, DHA2 family, multidrug resistance protein